MRPVPRSLVNIYRELETDLGLPTPSTGDLTPWADQGVLLLNRVLTVTPGKPASHRGRGWETVTARAIEALVERGGPLVAILWGRDARGLVPHLARRRVHRVAAPEPAVGARRLLRVAPVQPRQRAARPPGGGPRRLEDPVTPTAASRRVWTRYVAIGDSFTEGMSDPDPTHPDRYVGWADRLAHHLDAVAEHEHLPFGYANLAVRGRKLDDVVGPQLDNALSDAARPGLDGRAAATTCSARRSTSTALASRLEEAVVRLRHAGTDVLLATPTDTRDAGLFKTLRGRHAVHTANLFTIAQRHGCFVLNLWGMAALRDWRMWADDRIHLTGEGHRRVALAALTALGHRTDLADWTTPLPPADRATRARGAARPRRVGPHLRRALGAAAAAGPLVR